MLAIVAPGQGAQVPGFLAPWLELPHFRPRLAWLSACAGMDLARYGTEADADTIRDTAVAQPLIVASGLTALLELFPHPAEAYGLVGVGAGHSVGELTAAAAAHVISAEQAMVLVRERGLAMAEAAAATATGMTAVLGGDRDDRARQARRARSGRGERQRGRPDRRRRYDSSSSRPSPPTRPRALACASSRWRARSTPSTWHRRSDGCAPSPARSPRTTRGPGC